MSLITYKALELQMDGRAATSLFERMDTDTREPTLRLTGGGDPDAMSGNLTPAMNAWLSAEVGPSRRAAIAAIEAAAAQIPLDGGVQGISPEIEDDKLKRQRNESRSEAHKAFYDRHGRELEELKEVETAYLRMRVFEGKREPRIPGRLVDLLIPLAIMIPEGFMNYKYFYDYLQLGIVALGSTIVVGLGIGWSAYLTGRFLKGFDFYMQPDNDRQRAEGIRMISIANSLLLISLMAVGAVRYLGIVKQVPEYIALGQLPPNAPVQTGILLFGNLLVFSLGAAITYWLHDKNPLYAEKAEVHKRLKDKVERLRKKELIDKLDQIGAAYKQSSERMRNLANLMNGQPGYVQIREQIGALSAKDSEVLAVLQEYRGRLCRRLAADTAIFLESGETIDVPAFAALRMDLYKC